MSTRARRAGRKKASTLLKPPSFSGPVVSKVGLAYARMVKKPEPREATLFLDAIAEDFQESERRFRSEHARRAAQARWAKAKGRTP
jgi:hypothetical protein